ncbi:MAG: spore maturation protein A [Oscillospiraceae bacterium]|nr:spore maturation protein A [Oscillospiraceae bacterium]
MIGILWIGIFTVSLFSGFLYQKIGVFTPAIMEGAQKSIEISISLAGPLCLWSSVAKVMERSGFTQILGKILHPFFRKLFPESAKDPQALGYLSSNLSANLLGLGNAATPMGIAAAKRMQQLHGTADASDELCRLIILNTASIQLLPTTVASVRAALGSAAPFDILPGVWICSLCSVTMGLLGARILRRFYA